MTSLAQAIDLHLDALRAAARAPATVRKAFCSIAQFRREQGLADDFLLAGVTAERVAAFLRRGRESKWASRTERRHFQTLLELFAFCVSAGLLEDSPMAGMEAPSYVDRPRQHEIYSEADLQAMLVACDRLQGFGRRNRAIVWVLWSTGLWPSELVRLRVGDVDLERGAVQLKTKLAPLPKAGAAELGSYIEARGRRQFEEIFVSRTGRPMTTQGVEKFFGDLGALFGRPVNAGSFRASLRARGGLWKRPRAGKETFANRDWPDCPLTRARNAFFAANDARGLSSSTRETYERAVGRFLAYFLPDHPAAGPEEISTADMEAYLTYLSRRNLSDYTRHQMYRSMRRWFAFLEERGEIAANPMAKMRAPRLPHVVVRPYSESDVSALLQEASRQPDEAMAARDVAAITVLYGCGLRAGEVLNLRADDILPGQLLIRQGKGSKDRYVALDPHTETTLRRYAARNGGGRIFGSLRSTFGLYHAVARLCDRAGVEKYRIVHRFRDSFAVRFLEAGGAIDDLQTLLGHSDLSTTLRYVRHGRESRAIAASKAFLPWASRNGHSNGNGAHERLGESGILESPAPARNNGDELALLEELERITRRKLELLVAPVARAVGAEVIPG